MSDPLAELTAAEERGLAALRTCEDALISASEREERLAGIHTRASAETKDDIAARIPGLRTRGAR